MTSLSTSQTLTDWKRFAKEKLTQHGIERSEASLEVKLIAERQLGLSAAAQILYHDRALTFDERNGLNDYIDRRCQREPLAHLFGTWEFWGLPIKVSRDTLIPRADTEVLVEEAVQWLKDCSHDRREGALVLDIGAGSGCISMAIASEHPECRFSLLDLSEAALEIAKQGWGELVMKRALSEKTVVKFIKSDGLNALTVLAQSQLEAEEPLLIVTNPPYVKLSAKGSLLPEVSDYDPHLALFDERADGLGTAERFISESFHMLTEGGALFMEVGFDQTEQAQEIFERVGFTQISRRFDYGGNPRVVSGVKP